MKTNDSKIKLPEEVEKAIKSLAHSIVESEKENIKDSDALQKREEEIEEGERKHVLDTVRKLLPAKQLLIDYFEQEERTHPELKGQTPFSLCEDAVKTFAKKSHSAVDIYFPLQETLQLPWDFMHKCFRIGRFLLNDLRYDEAESVFLFLQLLNPMVFDYWIGLASAQYMKGEYEDALSSFGMSLILEPENPIPFFYMASSLYNMGEKEAALQSLQFCLQYCEGGLKEEYKELFHHAQELEKILQK